MNAQSFPLRLSRAPLLGALFWFGLTTAHGESSATSASNVLWYDRPARSWMTEALPLGNGSLGGMIFGSTTTERLQFNHNTLWTGGENDTGMYQAFGDVFIQLGHTAVSDYRRELDIDFSIQKISYRANGVHYQRRAFASHPAQVMIYQFTADQSAAHSGRIWLADMHDAKISGEGKRLTLSGRLGKNGLEYEAQLVVLHDGGKVRVETQPLPSSDQPPTEMRDRTLPQSHLVFEGCNNLTLVLAADTNYAPDRRKNWRGDSPHAAVSQRVEAVAAKNLSDIFAVHVADYQQFFRRYQIDLGTTAPVLAAKPTNQRLISYTQQKTHDPDLEELLAQYGRYLLISSSRPGGLPANLQGLWNDTNTPKWRCDYHSNINVEMNYWPAESTNLSELHQPFLDYVSSQIPVARERSREEYGQNVRGWTVRTENGIFGGGSFLWNPPGSAWYAQHYWEHYAFSQDRRYLAEVAYPLMKEVCQFWQDRLVKRPDGSLVTPVGWSPEQGPKEEAITYDLEIVHDLFTNTIEAADVLKIDRSFRDQIATMRKQLLKLKIGRWGQLQEWESDRDDPKNDHRHASHLFALHPGRQITVTNTPALFEAAKVSLKARGDGGTGWSRAWKINFWARLQDGDHAYSMLRNLMTAVTSVDTDMKSGGGLYPNLLDAHPPFQIDGNFGATAGVAEMLVQSQSGEIMLLPALPQAWPDGSVKGLCARGGVEVDLTWKAGKLQSATLLSKSQNLVRVRIGKTANELTLSPNKSLTINGQLQPAKP